MSVLIKGGRVVTASDDYVADVFVEGERVTLIGESLDARRRPDDRRTRQVRPAGLRRPAHPPRHALRRHGDDRRRRVGPDGGGVRRHDLPRRLLHPGQGAELRRGARRLAREGRGQAADRHGLPHRGHRPLGARARSTSSPTLPDQGVTSYKLFMAYKGALMVDDETLFRTMEVAARTGALVMVHAENGDVIDVLVQAGARRRPHRAALARAHAAARDRGRGDQPRDPARPHRRLRRSTSSTSPAARRSSRSRPRARRAGTSGARPAPSTSSSTTTLPRAAGLRGREVRLHAAAARQGEPGRALGRRRAPTCSR